MSTQCEDNDIVITGISGRLPESSNIEEFKQNLMNEIDMVTEDERRWPAGMHGVPLRTGKIKDLDRFDAIFFGVHAMQANVMDPQNRILLEVAYEAIVDAGINPSSIKGSRTGVFIGVCFSESEHYWSSYPENVNGYELIGSCRTMFANRISFVFNFTGPSYAIDVGCSSSLSALHQAVASIRAGECDAAIAGGVNLLLDPTRSLNFCKLNMLCPDGKCKTFDATANGYVRAEAVVAIYLQKAKDAHRIYATVIHTKTNTDGYKSKGITYPSGEMQHKLLNELYSEANINPADVSYVEAHGTGTKAGDPEEVNAIDRIFCKNRKTPLLMGSVKSNMGHAEATSGLCGVAKVLMAMEAEMIPANLHFNTPNPCIPALKEGRVIVVNKATPWNGDLVGISSHGFGGTNVHIILRSNPKPKLLPLNTELLPKLVAVSGSTKEAVHVLLNNAKKHRKDDEFISLLHAVHNNDIPRHRYRGFEILGHNDTRELTEKTSDGEKRPIWFIFSGMGGQWTGMGRELLCIKTFQCSLQRCADVLRPHGIDLMKIIMCGTDETYKNIINSSLSIVAIQIALVDVLTSIGINPDGLIGHSIGEISCAYSDGALTLEQTILMAYHRNKSIVDSKLEPGAMAAVGLSWEEARKMCPSDINLACHNSEDLVTVSGPIKSVRAFVEELKKKNIFAKFVDTSGIAFHSKYIASIESKLRVLFNKIIPNPKRRSTKWISSSIPKTAWGNSLAQFASPEYFITNTLSPVFFRDTLTQIPENAITIEIGPHCLLQSILRKSLPLTVTILGLQKWNHSNNLVFLLSNLGKLYITGAQPDISKLYPSVSFPVGRGTPMIGSLIKWDHSVKWDVPNFIHSKQYTRDYTVQVDTSKETNAYIAGHQIDGRIIFPGTIFILMIWKLFAKMQNTDFEHLSVAFKNIFFQRAIIVSKDKLVKFSINIFEGTGDFEICTAGAVIISGNIRILEIIEKDQLKLLPPPTKAANKTILLNTKDIYKEMKLQGHEYSDIFKGIKFCDNQFTIGELFRQNSNEWVAYISAMFQFGMMGTGRKHKYARRVRYIAIDPVLHKQVIEKLSEESGLPVYFYKNVNIIKSGGIMVKGLTYVLTQRQQQAQNLKYKRYNFVPYESSHNLAEDTSKGKLHALSVLLQIVRENLASYKYKIIEVVGERTAEALLTPLILDIIDNEVALVVDLKIATILPSNYTENFNKLKRKIDVVTWDANTAPTGSIHENMQLVVAANILTNQFYTVLKNLVTALKLDGFILLEETNVQLDIKTALEEVGLTLIGKQTDGQGKNYLLLKKLEKKGEPIVIKITENNFSWLQSVKTILKKFDSECHLLFVSEGKEVSGIMGFVNCLQREISSTNVRYVYIQDENAPKFDLSAQFYMEQLDKGLIANVLKGGQWGSYRYLPFDPQSTTPSIQVKHAYVNSLMREGVRCMRWIESPLNYYQPDKLSSTLCSVYYAPLNCRDIKLMNGKLLPSNLPEKMTLEDCVFGLEFSGRDPNGRRVMGMVEVGGLATTLLADPGFLWEVPNKWTLEQAATIPFTYVLSYYALFVQGKLKTGESVWIHTDISSMCEAAIAISLHAGCTVFATVATLENRLYFTQTFPQLPNKHIGYFQDTSFEQLIFTETQKRGVDVVLNLVGEEKLKTDIECLAKRGRFLDIRRDELSNSNHVMSKFSKNITFHSIMLDGMWEDSVEKREIIRLVSDGIKNGAVHPLPTTVFSEQQLEKMFRFMAAGNYNGKILLKIRNEEPEKCVIPTPKTVAAVPRTYMNPEKSYVLIGGLGGFGLELANWMIERGAKCIIFVTRSKIRTNYQVYCMQRWRESGVKIVIFTEDITTLQGVERLIADSNRLAPIGGIFNLALVLRDALLENLEEADFEMVIGPKLKATKNLDMVSRRFCPLLDYFVVFSSMTSGHGNLGQTNYGFANSAMERTIEQRHANDLPGLAVQWGLVGDVGVMAEVEDKSVNFNTSLFSGTLPQRISSCLATLDIFLQQRYPVLCSIVVAEKQKSANDGKISLIKAIANILGIKDVNLVNPNDSLNNLGMDSLRETEIKYTLEMSYGITLSSSEIHALTFNKMRVLST